MNELQTLADRLADELGRAVYLEDRAFQPLAASTQVGHIDNARVEALLYRQPTDSHLAYFAAAGVSTARHPVRIPASDEHGLLRRVVVPVLSGAELLARVWLIDSRPAVSDEEIHRVQTSAAEMLPHLLDRNSRTAHTIAAGGRLAEGLSTAGRKRRESLFRQLCDHLGLQEHETMGAHVAHIRPRQYGPDPAWGAAARSELLKTCTEILGPRRAAGTLTDDSLHLLVVTPRTGASIAARATEVIRHAATLHGFVAIANGTAGPICDAEGSAQAFRRAEFAARVAKHVAAGDDSPRSMDWRDLGEYRLFSELEWSVQGVASIHAGIAALLTEGHRFLASTLLAYLEREGDVDATADALGIHRTTLYYRLRRVNERLGQGTAGSSRLAVHAALRFAHLVELC